jgi:hypothetical protein
MALAPAQQGPSKPDSNEKPSVEELIKRLNSDEYKTRVAATRALSERDDARSAVRKAARSKHLEVSKRAKLILGKLEERASKQRMERLLARIKNGQVDEFVDQMVFLEQYLDERIWRAVLDLADRIVAKVREEKKQRLLRVFIPGVDRSRDKLPYRIENFDKSSPNTAFLGQMGLARRLADPHGINRCVIVSQGLVQARVGWYGNLIFANGDVTMPKVGSAECSLVVCDGNIQADFVSTSILITTGKVRLKSKGNSIILEDAHEALGLVKFYDVKQSGIEVEQVKDSVAVKKVHKGKPFAEAGVQEGDHILTLDGTKIDSLDVFRRLVRRNAMANNDIVLTVERPGKGKLNITVELTD